MYRVSDGVRSTHGQDGAVVLDIGRGRMFSINRVGSRILELLEAGAGQNEIVSTISEEFSTDAKLVQSDVRKFVEALQGYGLVTENPAKAMDS